MTTPISSISPSTVDTTTSMTQDTNAIASTTADTTTTTTSAASSKKSNNSTSFSSTMTSTSSPSPSSLSKVSHGFSSSYSSWYHQFQKLQHEDEKDVTAELSSRVSVGLTLEASNNNYDIGSSATSSSTSNTNDGSTSRSRSNSITSAALDTLALLASSAHQQLSASDYLSSSNTTSTTLTNTMASTNVTDDSQIMPPPPPRIKNRTRSASNPEGMEKWDSYSYYIRHHHNPSGYNNNRRHFILPTTILEEELAEVNETCKLKEMVEDDDEKYWTRNSYFSHNNNNASAAGGGSNRSHLVPLAKRGMTVFDIQGGDESKEVTHNHNNKDHNNMELYGVSPKSVTLAHSTLLQSSKGKKNYPQITNNQHNNANRRKIKKQTNNALSSSSDNPTAVKHDDNPNSLTNGTNVTLLKQPAKEEENESTLEPEELLKRARSRLLEDLNCSDNSNNNCEKGALPLPHSLEKYKEVYNKNGRIGIYTPAERAAIIAKFNSKRTRRVWNKKIRYNCRKNLADRRMRVKGRFVKRAVEQENVQQQQKQLELDQEQELSKSTDKSATTESSSGSSSSASSSRTTSPTSFAASSGPLSTVQEDEDTDVDMPDVNDPEAGFKPTLNQPFRRTRRHTIT